MIVSQGVSDGWKARAMKPRNAVIRDDRGDSMKRRNELARLFGRHRAIVSGAICRFASVFMLDDTCDLTRLYFGLAYINLGTGNT